MIKIFRYRDRVIISRFVSTLFQMFLISKDRVLRGTVSCAAVSNKTAAFYCFMFPEAKKQQDLIKFTPVFSWRVLE